jgi:transposase InsO family protein
MKNTKYRFKNRGVFRIHHQDQYGIVWCCLAVKYPVKNHPERLSLYKKYFNEISIKDLELPLQIKDFPLFENLNPDFGLTRLSVNSNDNYKAVTRDYISTKVKPKYKVIEVLIDNITSGICTNPASLLSATEHGVVYCDRCFHRFNKTQYIKHTCVNDKIEHPHVELKFSSLSSELHKPNVVNFVRKPIMVRGIDDTWCADLVDMSSFSKDNYGYKWILTIIDVMSRYVWVVPLFNKKAEGIVEAFSMIFEESKRKPRKLWVDEGKEFENKQFSVFFEESTGGNAEKDIYHTYGKCKTPILDRFHRSLKTWMWKKFTDTHNQHWIAILHEIVHWYNTQRIHRSIKMTPAEASDKSKETNLRILQQQKLDDHQWVHPAFITGDYVRMLRDKKRFEKSYTEKWSQEIFIIDDIKFGKPHMYKLRKIEGEVLKGSFYKEELQLTEFIPETSDLKHEKCVYEVENIVGEKVENNELFYLVKWIGYSTEENTWERIGNLLGDEDTTGVVEMIKKYQDQHPTSNEELLKFRSKVF